MTPRLPDCRPRIRPKIERNVALTVPAGRTRPGWPKPKTQLKLSRPRMATSPETIMPRTAEDCGRSATGDWLSGALARDGLPRYLRRGARAEIARSGGLILGSEALTRPAPQDYIDPLGRAAAWRDGASAKPLTVSHGDRASGHALYGHVRSPRRMWRALCSSASAEVLRLRPKMSGRRSCEAPGCLKSESEERETWTAESLRAASSNGEDLGSKDLRPFLQERRSWKRLRRSYVSRFSTSADCASDRTCRDLVKRCD